MNKEQKKTNNSRPYMRKAERKLMIAHAASSIFARKGYHRTSIEDICRECKIAQGTLYLHFSGKLEIFRMAVTDALTKIQDIAKPININSPKDREAVDQGVFNYLYQKNLQAFRVISENRDLLRIVFREAIGLDDEITALVNNWINSITRIIETELTIFKTMGFKRDIDTKIAAIVIVGTMQMVMNAMLEDDDMIKDIDALARKVTDLLMFGTSRSGTADQGIV